MVDLRHAVLVAAAGAPRPRSQRGSRRGGGDYRSEARSPKDHPTETLAKGPAIVVN